MSVFLHDDETEGCFRPADEQGDNPLKALCE